MSRFDEAAEALVADCFAELGHAATMYPHNGGGPIDCTVQLKRWDQIQEIGGASRTRRASHELMARASEVPEPARGDLFVVGSVGYRVLETATAEAPRRQVWLCLVAEEP